jgi:hypothetical protein
VSKAIRAKQRYLREENRKYGIHMERVSVDAYPYEGIRPVAVFRSRSFLAQVFEEQDGAVRISIMRTMVDEDGEWLEGISWNSLIAIKNECGFSAHWAVEIFPPADEIVDVANMRHLFVLPEAPAFAWRKSGLRRIA